MTDHGVTLDLVSPSEGPLLSNLLELYTHDLSAVFDVTLGSDGRFGYQHLESYLSGAGDRFGFLIRCHGAVAGFALATRGSPVAEGCDVLDLAEFFVLRRFRGRGLGRAAAGLLWDRLPGTWIVRAAVIHPDAIAFWRAVVAAYTNDTASESKRRVGSKEWVVFSFDSTRR